MLENVVLGTEPLLAPRLDARRGARKARTRSWPRAASTCRPTRRVSRLSVGEQQRVEILKALYRGARILVLDEPTAVLTPQEATGCSTCCADSRRGGLSIIFITHKLDEVLAIADRVAVLRAGRKVADRPAAGADRARARRPDGRARGRAKPPRAARARATPLLALDRVTRATRAGPRRADGRRRSTVRAGEIVGIAGVSGNGQGGARRHRRRHRGRRRPARLTLAGEPSRGRRRGP